MNSLPENLPDDPVLLKQMLGQMLDERQLDKVPRQLISKRPQATEIRFEYDKPASPQSLGISADSRQLGLGLIWLKLLPVAD
jgi:hypothetical protein